MEWISVEKQTPPPTEDVLLLLEGSMIVVGIISGFFKRYHLSFDSIDAIGGVNNMVIRYYGVTHWMPLPEPPKSKQ